MKRTPGSRGFKLAYPDHTATGSSSAGAGSGSFTNTVTGLSPGTPSEYDPRVDPRANAVTAAWDMVVADLDARHPTLVLDTAAAGMKSYGKFPVSGFPVLARYLETHYRIEGTVNGVVFYRRIDST